MSDRGAEEKDTREGDGEKRVAGGRGRGRESRAGENEREARALKGLCLPFFSFSQFILFFFLLKQTRAD